MSNFQDAYDAGRAHRSRGDVIYVNDIPYLVTDDGNGAAVVRELSSTLPAPRYLAQSVTIHDHASFVAYVGRFRDPDSVVFADRQACTLTAVLDYHRAAPGQPPATESTDEATDTTDDPRARWGRHVATLNLRHTPEWKVWIGQNGKKVSQLEFAEFLENNLADVASPPGAELLDIATRLEASKSARFAAGVRLSDGQTQITYEETIAGAAGEKGALTIPPTFVLGLAPFEGSERYRLEARFRYRIADGGKLTVWYDLLRPHKVLEDAFGAVLTATAAALPGVPIVHGQRQA